MTCPIYLHIDNTGAICISEKNINNQRTKHIDIRYHHIRDWVQSKVVKIEKVKSLDNTADIFTKSLPTQLHVHHAGRCYFCPRVIFPTAYYITLSFS